MTDKRLRSKIYKQLIPINIKKNKQPKLKMGKRTEQTFFLRRHTDGQQVHEKMLNIINHQGNAIKTTMRYYPTPIRMAVIKKTENKKFQQKCGEKGILLHAGGNVN